MHTLAQRGRRIGTKGRHHKAMQPQARGLCKLQLALGIPGPTVPTEPLGAEPTATLSQCPRPA